MGLTKTQSGGLEDQSVTLDKLPHGTSSNDGKFLRANNGADPTFETVPSGGISNVVEDTSPQLGGDLDTNGNNIDFADGNQARFGNLNTGDLYIYHDSQDSYINNVTGILYTRGDTLSLNAMSTTDKYLQATNGGSVDLYYDNALRLDTTNDGADIRSDGSAVAVKLKTSGGTTRGWLYANNGNMVGLLDEGGDWAIKHINNTSTEFYVATNKKATINTHGLTFNNDTAAANALDDYETGTWTPTQGNFNTFSLSSGQFNAQYTKIGNIVHFSFEQTGGTLDWSQAQYIGGLPFTVNKNGAGSWSNNYPNSGGEMIIWGTNVLYFAQTDGYNTSAYKLVFSGTYETNQ